MTTLLRGHPSWGHPGRARPSRRAHLPFEPRPARCVPHHLAGLFSPVQYSYAFTEPCSDSSLVLQAVSWRKLVEKNVAEHIGQQICESVCSSLLGKACGSFTTLSTTVRGLVWGRVRV